MMTTSWTRGPRPAYRATPLEVELLRIELRTVAAAREPSGRAWKPRCAAAAIARSSSAGPPKRAPAASRDSQPAATRGPAGRDTRTCGPVQLDATFLHP